VGNRKRHSALKNLIHFPQKVLFQKNWRRNLRELANPNKPEKCHPNKDEVGQFMSCLYQRLEVNIYFKL